MPDKMTVLFVKHTGHILAAVTRSANPTGNISAEDLARGGLLVRGLEGDAHFAPPGDLNVQFEVPPRELDVLTVDLDPALLLQPRAFFVDENRKVLPVSSADLVTVTLKVTTVKVELDPLVQEDREVWVQITGGDLTQPLIATGIVPKNVALPPAPPASPTVDLSLVPLNAGNYDVLTLIATLQPHVATKLAIP